MGSGIRRARVEDAEAISRLNGELGRSGGEAEIKESLARLLASDRDVVLVSETSEGLIVGWLHAADREALGSGRRCEILGLVVDPAHRGRGEGRRLVAGAEGWATANGLSEVLVRSNIARPESHPFYERLGYMRSKTQHVYRRRMLPGRTG